MPYFGLLAVHNARRYLLIIILSGEIKVAFFLLLFGPCCYCAKKLHIRQQLNDWLIFYTQYALLCSFTTASGDILETFIYAHNLSIK